MLRNSTLSFNLLISITIIVIVIIIVKLFESNDEEKLIFDAITNCHRRYFDEQNSFVCVCNENYCDDNLEIVAQTPSGTIQSYETNRRDKRLWKRIHMFENIHHHHQRNSINYDIEIHLNHHHYNHRNRMKTYQKIIGFGGAFTDSTGINLGKLSKNLQRTLINDYFGDNGIGYSLARIPIGGTDFSIRPYTLDDNPDDDLLLAFRLQFEDYHYKIPYIRMAQQIAKKRKLQFFASPWSPPAWMKTNNRLNHGGFLKGKPGEKYYKLFAKYIVKFLQEYHREKIPIWGLTIVNEPLKAMIPEWQLNSLILNSTFERDFLRLDLGPELKRNGFDMDNGFAIMVYDDQLPQMKSYVETIMQDGQAAKYVSGFAFHWYDNYKSNRNDLDELYEKYTDKFLLPTEACILRKNDTKRVHLGDWNAFNYYASDIINDLNHFATGWIDWNLALDMDGGPSWAGNAVDAPIIINTSANEYYKQPTFYAIGHFSKFLPPNSIRIHFDIFIMNNDDDDDDRQMINDNDDNQSILVTALKRPDNGTVLIILNQNKQSKMIKIKDFERGQFSYEMDAESMVTLLWY